MKIVNTESGQIPENPQEPELLLRLTLAEIDVLLAHAGRGQYWDVARVMQKVFAQITPQVAEQSARAALASIPAASEQRN